MTAPRTRRYYGEPLSSDDRRRSRHAHNDPRRGPDRARRPFRGTGLVPVPAVPPRRNWPRHGRDGAACADVVVPPPRASPRTIRDRNDYPFADATPRPPDPWARCRTRLLPPRSAQDPPHLEELEESWEELFMYDGAARAARRKAKCCLAKVCRAVYFS